MTALHVRLWSALDPPPQLRWGTPSTPARTTMLRKWWRCEREAHGWERATPVALFL